jgi:hypothetical protein
VSLTIPIPAMHQTPSITKSTSTHTAAQIERHRKAHADARQEAREKGIYVYCPGDPPASVGLLGLVYGPSGEVAASPPAAPGETDFLRLIVLANEAIMARRAVKS